MALTATRLPTRQGRMEKEPAHEKAGFANGWMLRWGTQLDVQAIVAFGNGEDLTEQAVASCVAKYATKAAETTGTVVHRIGNEETSYSSTSRPPRSSHPRRPLGTPATAPSVNPVSPPTSTATSRTSANPPAKHVPSCTSWKDMLHGFRSDSTKVAHHEGGRRNVRLRAFQDQDARAHRGDPTSTFSTSLLTPKGGRVASTVEASKPRRRGISRGPSLRPAASSRTPLLVMTTLSRPGCSCRPSAFVEERRWGLTWKSIDFETGELYVTTGSSTPGVRCRAGLRVIPLRNTWHTGSSLPVALKVHPKIAQRILRHSHIATSTPARARKKCATLGQLSDARGDTG